MKFEEISPAISVIRVAKILGFFSVFLSTSFCTLGKICNKIQMHTLIKTWHTLRAH